MRFIADAGSTSSNGNKGDNFSVPSAEHRLAGWPGIPKIRRVLRNTCYLLVEGRPIVNEHEQLIRRLLSDRKKVEVSGWLKGGSADDERTIGACKTNRDSIRFVKEIYRTGAPEIIAVHIKKNLRRNSHHTGKLVVKLPQDAKSRKAIFNWCKQQGDSLGFSPDPDRGESHLFLLLD